MSVPELTVALAAADDQYRLAFALAAWCQLRRSEVLGLQRRDVHLADAAGLSLSVNRRIATTMTGEVHVGLPKTEAGRRRLAIPSHLVEDIEAHLEQFVGPGSDALLFHRDDGTPVRPITLTRALNRPGFPGDSKPWKGWSHGEQDNLEAVSA
jgi:integrase